MGMTLSKTMKKIDIWMYTLNIEFYLSICSENTVTRNIICEKRNSVSIFRNLYLHKRNC